MHAPRRCADCTNSTQRVIEMIVEQRSTADILAALCQEMGGSEAERQVAFFLFDGADWKLAAAGAAGSGCRAALAQVRPGELSAALFDGGESAPETGAAFAGGWVRHLYSGIGELLGLFVSLADGPMLPFGRHAAAIFPLCRLAALAVEQKNLVDELSYQADHDAVTGLLNRGCFNRMLAGSLKPACQGDGSAALLYINLDRFRLVNDVMGHSVGDRLLAEVGRRFQTRLPADAVLARAGGDEFTVLLPRVSALEDARTAAERLLESLADPFFVDGHELFVGASIGLGYSTAESTPASLQRTAYVALRSAKQAGKGRCMHFHSGMALTPPERLEMEKQLRMALSRNEMVLYFQPQVSLASGLVTGAEVLLRWRPSNVGIVSAAAFIPILEESGLILEHGRWVLREACRQGQEWRERLGRSPRLGVNVSALQFRQRGFVEQVEEALGSTGFPPDCLELELTESLFIGDYEAACRVFRDLRSTGVTMALDDFGIGQSSLSYLHRLPFQRLKIDQSFVRPIGDGDPCPPLVGSILRIAATLEMATIAEGIESRRQAEILREAGCGDGQGFLFSRPLPAADFEEFWQGGQALSAGAAADAGRQCSWRLSPV